MTTPPILCQASTGIDLFVGLALVCALIIALVLLARLFAFIGDLLAGVRAWAVRQRRERENSADHAFPVLPALMEDGRGSYRVAGVLRTTEQEVEWQIEAQTRANAIAKAELRGLVVTKVKKLPAAIARSGEVA